VNGSTFVFAVVNILAVFSVLIDMMKKRALWIACVRRVRNAVIFFLGREKVMNAPFCSILCSVAFAVRMAGLSFSFHVTAGS